MNTNDLTLTSIETVTAFDIATGDYMFTLDELQSTTIAQSQEKTDITGKGGRKLSSLKRSKAVTISGANGLISGGLMELQTGGSFENKETEVLWIDYLTVDGDKTAVTTWKAVGTIGAEIDAVYVRNPDGTLGGLLHQGAEAGEGGQFQYSPETKKITFATDMSAGTEIVVYYKRKVTADVLENRSDQFSKKCSLYIDAIAEDKCNGIYRVQFYIPKADFSGDFSCEIGDNQTVHSFEAEALSGACGASGTFFTYTVFGANTPDAVGAASVK